jgi:putative tricarboxylic transport membrane protein
LIVLGLVLFGRAVKQKDNQKRTEPLLSGGNKKILAVIGLGFLYVLFMEKIGFILATILFILAVMAVTGERNWRTVVISSLGVSLVLYLLFKEVLQVMLPTGFGL